MNRRSFLKGVVLAPVAAPHVAKTYWRQGVPPSYPPPYFTGYGQTAKLADAGSMARETMMPPRVSFSFGGDLIETPGGYDMGWMGGVVANGPHVELFTSL